MAIGLLNATEYTALIQYLGATQYRNLHTRRTGKKNKQTILKHLHGLHKLNAVLEGFVCGPGAFEIEYEIDSTGAVTITQASVSIAAAYQYIQSYIKKEIMQRVGQGHTNKFNPKRKKGHFYLRRDANAVVAASANAAVANGILTMAFVTSMASWSLRVIQGQ